MTAHSRPTGPTNCHTINHDKLHAETGPGCARTGPSQNHMLNRCRNSRPRTPQRPCVRTLPLPQQLTSETPQRHCADAAAATAGIRDAATPNPPGGWKQDAQFLSSHGDCLSTGLVLYQCSRVKVPIHTGVVWSWVFLGVLLFRCQGTSIWVSWWRPGRFSFTPLSSAV